MLLLFLKFMLVAGVLRLVTLDRASLLRRAGPETGVPCAWGFLFEVALFQLLKQLQIHSGCYRGYRGSEALLKKCLLFI